ncbi:MAG TPA: TonB-dependent receptor, partial [Steroidobacteraceae bacterium]|nr:TonB-dependent receptor [Steroidobacteraceae bacterium]
AFGYSYTDTEIVQSDQAIQIGSRLQSAPLHAGHVWSRYDVRSGVLQGFGVGLGVVYSGFRLGILPTSTNPAVFVMPSYTTADVGLYYARERFNSTLRISNLFDEHYIETGGFSGETQIQPGAARNIALSLKVDLW